MVVGGLVAKSCPTLATPWTVACQAPLFMGFSRQEEWVANWSGLPFPSPEEKTEKTSNSCQLFRGFVCVRGFYQANAG